MTLRTSVLISSLVVLAIVLQRGQGRLQLAAGIGQLGQCLGEVVALLGDRGGDVVDVLERRGNVIDVFLRQQLADSQQRLVDAGDDVLARREQLGQGRFRWHGSPEPDAPRSAAAACWQGDPPDSWMKAVPVTPSRPSLASVSTLTGVSPSRRMRAMTLRGSSGASLSWVTSPTLMPLYCTRPPLESPVTASVKTTS